MSQTQHNADTDSTGTNTDSDTDNGVTLFDDEFQTNTNNNGNTGSTDTNTETTERESPTWKQTLGTLDAMNTSPKLRSEINIDTLSLLCDHISGIVGESRLAVTHDGIFIRGEAPSTAAATTAWLDASEFERYSVETPGVMAAAWDGRLGKLINQPDRSNTVTFNITGRDIGAHVTINDGIKMTTECYSPDAIREQPPEYSDEMYHQAELSITGTEFERVLKRCDSFDDYITFTVGDNDRVKVTAGNDASTIEKTYTGSDDVAGTTHVTGYEFESHVDTNATITPEQWNDTPEDTDTEFERDDVTITAEFQNEFLLQFVSSVRKTDLRVGFTIEYGHNNPLRVRRELGTNSFIRATIAPRIRHS
jgi:hypothetical protein